ncbi:MAG TPA: HEAT repeat domain-containing protein [Gemmatimonadales bacterium]|nr:HEAT repeat domain-containing protein [Gemmatimonadales bacterium]
MRTAARGRIALVLPCLLAWGPPALAQNASVVEAVAPLLQAEDARRWAAADLEAGVRSPEPLVRRSAAMAIGRIGDLRGTALLVPMLQDQDSTVQTVAAFALGLLRDSAAVGPLASRLAALPGPTAETAKEVIAAVARIGGPAAADLIDRVLNGTANIAGTPNRGVLVRQAAIDAWRLGELGPTRQLIALAQSDDDELRWRVIFSLGQLRAPAAGAVFVTALNDAHPMVRAYGARALTAPYAAAAGLEAGSVVQMLVRASRDEQAGVRINALRSLGTYRREDVATQIVSQLSDPVPNVQVAAASAVAQSGGRVAEAQLARIVREGKGTFALQREALLGLARVSPDSFRILSGAWTVSKNWPDRASAAEGWGWVAPGPDVSHPDFLNDPDGRVAAAALQGWVDAVPGPDPALLAASRGLLTHADVGVRTLAARAIGRAPVPADLASLAAAYNRAGRDSVPDAAIAALDALRTLAASSEAEAGEVARDFLSITPRPANYVLRLWADATWPEAADRWGPAFPLETNRTLQDYREIASRFVAAPEAPEAHPHIFIETDQRGTIEVELLGPEAPLTVVNFLTLLDRRFFDHGRWQRVIPNLVSRDGDPRGDGWGGPGYAIRDEISQRRFDGFVLAMSLSGPDTGGSQWFFTLGPQPQLDGTYTIFGRVVGSPASLLRITQGDQIRLVRR